MKKINLLRIFKLVADDAAAIFPYLLTFYLISVFLSLFFPVWRDFFYWPALHAGIILFALLGLGSVRPSAALAFLWKQILFWKGKLGVYDYLKLIIVAVVLSFSLFKGVDIFSFLILFFGLVSVFFRLDMRISAGCALVFLAVTPALLALSQNKLAEITAVYAYYFLVIAVFTEISVIHSTHKGG